jgi:hypothetical protein
MLHGLPMRRVPAFLLSFVLAWALVLASRGAWAQTTPSISGIASVPVRCENTAGGCDNADNAGNHPHPNGITDNFVNFEDCEANLYYQFALNISNPSSSYNLQAWVGTQDCSQLANRQTSATSVCWPVAPLSASLVNPAIINVRTRDIASGAFTTEHPVSYVATGQANGDDSVCQSQTQTGSTSLVLYFFFADASSNPVGTAQQYNITLDMRAGDVQGSISAGIGDTVLIVSIPQTTDPDTQGYNVYCDPPPGQETASETIPYDAASNNGVCEAQAPVVVTDSATDSSGVASTDAEVDDGATTVVTPSDEAGGNPCGVSLNDSGIPSPGGCSASNVLVAGGGSGNLIATTDEAGQTVYVESGIDTTDVEGGVAISGGNMVMGLQYGQPTTAKYLCGYGSASSTTVNVTGLRDGYYYNIAVGAVDGAGNVGPLSNVTCGEPVPVADFWRLYYDAGGKAGGGFCSLEGVGMPAGTSGLGVLMVASIVAMIRKRTRKNEKNEERS